MSHIFAPLTTANALSQTASERCNMLREFTTYADKFFKKNPGFRSLGNSTGAYDFNAEEEW